MKGQVEAERAGGRLIEVRAPAEGGDSTFEAYAQLYGQPNDYDEVFELGCFAKSIVERIKAPQARGENSRVKVNDAHRWNSSTTVGVIVDAREEPKGLWVRGRLASTPDAQAIRAKMLEGIIDEFSIEFRSVVETMRRVGDATFRHIEEAMLWGLGILPYSSQGEQTLLEVRSALPYQDLPVAADETHWEPEAARARVLAWARGTLAGLEPNASKVRRAFLREDVARRGSFEGFEFQVADVIDGELRVVPRALMRAAADLCDAGLDGPVRLRLQAHVDRYLDRLRAEGRAAFRAPWHRGLDAIALSLRAGQALAEADRLTLAQELPALSAAVAPQGEPQESKPAEPAAAEPLTETSEQTDTPGASPMGAGAVAELRAAELELAALELEEIP